MNNRRLISVMVLIFLRMEFGFGDVIELKAKTIVRGEHVTVADIVASSQGLTAEDLAAVIADSPSLGRLQVWKRDEIEATLPTEIRAKHIVWAGAGECVISRPAATCKGSDVRSLLTTQLMDMAPKGSEIKLLEIEGSMPFLIAEGPNSARIKISPGTFRNSWGEATIDFITDGQVSVAKSFRFHWTCVATVWRAMEPTKAGDVLDSTKFEQINTDILSIPGEASPIVDFPDNKTAAHAIQRGAILMTIDLREPYLVNRNDTVTVTYEHGGLRITLQARALTSGVKDQVIQVQNTDSKKVFNARVVDERSLVYEN